MELQAIVFDFDGVLAESVSVKGAAFVELYKSESLDIQKQVMNYHQDNGGVSRFEKIRYYEQTLCNREITEERLNDLAARFSQIVEQKVVASAWVNGARGFLDKFTGIIPLYIASATPQEELERIVEKRGMTSYFKAILGTPRKKKDHLCDIIAQNNFKPDRVLMIGDAITDYDAAQAAGTRFIGRALPENPTRFPKGTPELKDLTGLENLIAELAYGS